MILADLINIRDIKTKKDKAFVLDKLGQDNAELLNIIFDKDVRFFTDINKVKKGINDTFSFVQKTNEELNSELLNLLKVLASEELRGNEAVAKCIDFADQLDPDECEMFYNVLENKTRLGIGATDINKLCQTFKIDQFMVMYAKRYDKIKNFDFRQPRVIQPKIDGNRQINIYDGKSSFFSRTGEPTTSLRILEEEFNIMFGKDNKCFIDGEVENGLTLESTGAIRSKSKQAEDAVYTIFGIYRLSDWESGNHTETYKSVYERSKYILEFGVPTIGKHIRLIPSYIIPETETEEEFWEIVNKYTQEFIEQGYEGSILKTLDHVYQPSAGTKRSNDWIKIKPSRDSDGIIVDIEEGEGEHQGLVGRFFVKWLDKICKISPGKISHSDRKYIWDNKEEFIGKKLEFQFQTLTAYGVPRDAFASKIRTD